MKNLNKIQQDQKFENLQENETQFSKGDFQNIGETALKIAEKTNHFSKKRERFDYLNNPYGENAKEHFEREIALKSRRKEEIEKGYFDEKDDFIVDPNDYKILSKQIIQGTGRVGIDLTATKYLKHGIALADTVSNYDTVVYLDKSAHPLDGLARKVLKTVLPDKKRPDSKFLNIDRNQIFAELGFGISDGYFNDGTENNGIAKTSHFINRWQRETSQKAKDRILAAVRSQFLDKNTEIDMDADEDEIIQQILNSKTTVEGKKVIAVDETSFSGATIGVASFLLQHALPEAKVNDSGFTFWESEDRQVKSNVGGEVKLTHGSVPVWYDKNNDFGRGIGERDEGYHNRRFENNPTRLNLLRKIGASVLASPHRDLNEKYLRDENYEDLMYDFDQLMHDFKVNKILISAPLTNYESLDIFYDLMDAQAESKGIDFQDIVRMNKVRNEHRKEISEFETFKKPI